MRKYIIGIVVFLLVGSVYGQGEFGSKKKILTVPKIEAPPMLAPKKPPLAFKMPEIGIKIEQGQQSIDFTGQNKKKYYEKKIELPPNVTGIEQDKDPDIGVKLEDQDFGDFTTEEKSITIYCRDHAAIDGDLVDIILNDEVIVTNVFLTEVFKGYTLPLKKGFNKIEIKALNMGDSPPNTAQFKVVDEKGKELINQQWGLSTGFKARFVMIKN